jgi:hypothetical protein
MQWGIPMENPIAPFMDKAPKTMDFSNLPSQILVFQTIFGIKNDLP